MTSESLSDLWIKAHESRTDEIDDVVARPLAGAIPRELRGVLYRIGPGRLERGGVRYVHPFDGDGMVVRFAFTDSGVRYRNRHIRTREFVEEEQAGKMLYRSFGTNLPGGLHKNAFRLRFKNAANTGMIYHGGKLLALWEGGMPHRLDPDTLETMERHDFDGRLQESGKLLNAARELPFSAHPKIDPVTDELYNFGIRPGYRSNLMLYRLDARGRMDAPRRILLDRLYFIHDFALTASYRVFFLCPVSFSVVKMLAGLNTPAGSIKASSREGEILIIPHSTGEPISIKIPSCFVFHVANAFEDRDGNIVIDCTRWDGFPAFSDLRAHRIERVYRGQGPVLTRFMVLPRRARVQERSLSKYSIEFPGINPRRTMQAHRFVWGTGAASAFNDPGAASIVKVDTNSTVSLLRSFAPDLPGEPLFVQRPGATEEDDGWLLATVYVGTHHCTDLVVLDARDLSVVYRARLPHHLPPGFHGIWIASNTDI